MKSVGRIGLRALLYFEVVSTIALVIGLVVINVYRPGVGINASPETLDAKAVAAYTSSAQHLSTVDFLMNIIPTTVVDAFAKGEILQVLLLLRAVRRGAAAPRRARPQPAQHHRRVHARALRHRVGSSCGWRRSGRSARWRSRSATTASARCCRSASSWPAST